MTKVNIHGVNIELPGYQPKCPWCRKDMAVAVDTREFRVKTDNDKEFLFEPITMVKFSCGTIGEACPGWEISYPSTNVQDAIKSFNKGLV